MTRRERLERKLQKRREWAEGREKKGEATLKAAFTEMDGIPVGQPILVGHHSEKRHRKAIERIDDRMRKGFEHHNMAKHHLSKAGGLEDQLAGSIFSDDPDAIEALEAKIAEAEASADLMNRANAAYKKAAGAPGWASTLGLSEEEAAKMEERVARLVQLMPYLRGRPFSATNTRANVRRMRRRVESIKAHRALIEKAEQAGGTIVEPMDSRYCRVVFSEKPERHIIKALRSAGYSWGSGSREWIGPTKNLPQGVSDVAGFAQPTQPEAVEAVEAVDKIEGGMRVVFKSTTCNGPMLHDVTGEALYEIEPGHWMFRDIKAGHEFDYDVETINRYLQNGGAVVLKETAQGS